MPSRSTISIPTSGSLTSNAHVPQNAFAPRARQGRGGLGLTGPRWQLHTCAAWHLNKLSLPIDVVVALYVNRHPLLANSSFINDDDAHGGSLWQRFLLSRWFSHVLSKRKVCFKWMCVRVALDRLSRSIKQQMPKASLPLGYYASHTPTFLIPLFGPYLASIWHLG